MVAWHNLHRDGRGPPAPVEHTPCQGQYAAAACSLLPSAHPSAPLQAMFVIGQQQKAPALRDPSKWSPEFVQFVNASVQLGTLKHCRQFPVCQLLQVSDAGPRWPPCRRRPAGAPLPQGGRRPEGA